MSRSSWSSGIRQTVRVPDVVVVATGLAEANLARVEASDVRVAVEILSPGTRRTDQVTKRAEYADAGIPHDWLVDLDGAPTLIRARPGRRRLPGRRRGRHAGAAGRHDPDRRRPADQAASAAAVAFLAHQRRGLREREVPTVREPGGQQLRQGLVEGLCPRAASAAARRGPSLRGRAPSTPAAAPAGRTPRSGRRPDPDRRREPNTARASPYQVVPPALVAWVDAGRRVGVHHGHDPLGQLTAPGRLAALVVDDVDGLALAPPAAAIVRDEVGPVRAVEPGRAHDPVPRRGARPRTARSPAALVRP